VVLCNFGSKALCKSYKEKAPEKALDEEKDRQGIHPIETLSHEHGDENHQEHEYAASQGKHDGHHRHDGFNNVLLGALWVLVFGHVLTPKEKFELVEILGDLCRNAVLAETG
jgi:hypothetical protein